MAFAIWWRELGHFPRMFQHMPAGETDGLPLERQQRETRDGSSWLLCVISHHPTLDRCCGWTPCHAAFIHPCMPLVFGFVPCTMFFGTGDGGARGGGQATL